MTRQELLEQMLARCGGYIIDIAQGERDADEVVAPLAIALHGEDGRTMLLEVGISALGVATATIRVIDDEDNTVQPTYFESPDGSVLLSA